MKPIEEKKLKLVFEIANGLKGVTRLENYKRQRLCLLGVHTWKQLGIDNSLKGENPGC